MTRILASAIVDTHDLGWTVTVEGASAGPDFDLRKQRRIYQIRAASDNIAAQEGIRLFVEELEALTE